MNIGCERFSNFETDEYYLKLPSPKNYVPQHTKDTSFLKIEYKKTQYNVSVITKNTFDCITLNDCISKELKCFLEGNETKNVVTSETEINGIPATVISGVNLFPDEKIFWTFAIIPQEYKYYVIRITSEGSLFSFNEFYNQKIINSFHLK